MKCASIIDDDCGECYGGHRMPKQTSIGFNVSENVLNIVQSRW